MDGFLSDRGGLSKEPNPSPGERYKAAWKRSIMGSSA